MAHQTTKARASGTWMSPEPKDTLPSEYQPPGVDAVSTDAVFESEPQSLEEALTG